MFVITVEFEVKPEHVTKFMTAMQENASLSLHTEPGCHQFDVCIAPDDPTKIFLYEVYTDKGAFEAHKKFDHFLEFDKTTSDWLISKSVAPFHRTWP